MAEASFNSKSDLPTPPAAAAAPANNDEPQPPAPAGKKDQPLAAAVDKEDPTSPAPARKENLPPPQPEAAAVVATSVAAGDTEPGAVTEKEEPPPSKEPTQPSVVEESSSLAAMMEKEASPLPPPTNTTEAEEKKEEVVAEAEAEAKAERKIPQSLISFKEESNVVADLSDFERDALKKLKELVTEALNNNQFTPPPAAAQPPESKVEEKQTTATTTQEAPSDTPKAEGPTSESDVSTELKPPQPESQPEPAPAVKEDKAEQKATFLPQDISIWGIPLMKDDRSDVILLKFLRAREFKVKDAFTMIKNTIQWRRDFGIESLMDEDLGDDLEKVVFMHGYDREGHPVCYNVYGEFENKELYQKTFSDEEKRTKFLRWRIQFLEKSIRKLDFRPGGINTIFQVNDLRNSPGPGKRELRLATKQALQLLQDNYPEFVAKQVFVNVPWWYLAFYTMISPFMTQRTKSKFVFCGPSKSAETLFKYISPEHVPILYGGLSVDYCDCNPEFTIADPVTDLTVKPGTKQTVEIIIYERCMIIWELRVVGWEVSYSAEFVPDAKDAYTVIIQKPTKMASTDEPVVSNRFKVSDLGRILLTIDNPTSKKKKLLYRFKIEPFSD